MRECKDVLRISKLLAPGSSLVLSDHPVVNSGIAASRLSSETPPVETLE
jgi:hypothetical protein